MMCRIETQTAIAKVELGELSNAIPTIGTCIKKGREEVKKLYPAALAKVSKNPNATKILKDYYAAWLTSFDAVMPQSSDTKRGYQLRQESMDEKSDLLWNRFEIEAGI